MPEENKQIEKMIERYGTNSLWVDVELHLTYDEMLKYFSEQCEEYDPLCHNCCNWINWHKTGKATIMFQREELIKLIFKDEDSDQ